jgi:hypothetical protein
MKKAIKWFALSAVLAMFLAPAILWAEEDENDDKQTITGQVEVTKDAGKVKKIVLKKTEKDEDGESLTVVYEVILDKKGLELEKYNGKNVTVVGVVGEKESGEEFISTIKVEKIVSGK